MSKTLMLFCCCLNAAVLAGAACSSDTVEEVYDEDIAAQRLFEFPRNITRFLDERLLATGTLPTFRKKITTECGREEIHDLSPLLWLLHANRFDRAQVVAERYHDPRTDVNGNTALHYLCKHHAAWVGSLLAPDALIEKLSADLNTTNKEGLTPIFFVKRTDLFVKLILMSGTIHPEAIASMRSSHWRDSFYILPTLYMLGFDATWLARTFTFSKSLIIEFASSPYLQKKFNEEVQRREVERISSASTGIIRALQLRQECGPRCRPTARKMH